MTHSSSASSNLNRSLERGIKILRAFRPGTDLLGNREIADRTGLAPATVSRLTQTLCANGMLEHDYRARAYRLGVAVLSLSHACKSAYSILQAASPLMKTCAEKLRINVGLAKPDQDEMVYLESFRFHRKASLRSILTGHRVPIELTSLGRAYLASLSTEQRTEVLELIQAKRSSVMPDRLIDDIRRSVLDVHQHHFCAVSWQHEVVALATPLVIDQDQVFILNMSMATQLSLESVSEQLAPSLLELKAKIIENLARA